MKNGFRTPAQSSKKVKTQNIETELQNIQMAARISQMMTQQLIQSSKAMSEDLGNALNQLYELQYKYTALQKHLNLDTESLNKIANEQRLVDFDNAALKQDVKDSLCVGDEVTDESTVTITTSAQDSTGNDQGIFRSRLKLNQSGVPDLVSGLMGKKVGDKVTVKLNDLDHTVELLSIRNPNQVEATTSETLQ